MSANILELLRNTCGWTCDVSTAQLKKTLTTLCPFPRCLHRVLHGGQRFWACLGTEGPPAPPDAEGERHPLHRLPLLPDQPWWLQPRVPQCLHKGGRGFPRQPCLERIHCDWGMGEGRAGHKHLLAQLLPGTFSVWLAAIAGHQWLNSVLNRIC